MPVPAVGTSAARRVRAVVRPLTAARFARTDATRAAGRVRTARCGPQRAGARYGRERKARARGPT